MIRLIGFVALALLLVDSPAATRGEETAGAGTEGASEGVVMRRATLLVRDAERSIAFYRDVLGYEVWLENEGTVSGSGLPIDVPAGSPSRFVIMNGRDPYLGMIGLLQYGEAQAPLETDGPRTLAAGDVILMIEAEDIENVHSQAQAIGATVYKPPGDVVRIESVGGNAWDSRFMYLYDPDGHMIEVTERLN